MDNEKRRRSRVDVRMPVTIIRDGVSYSSMTSDISLKGLRTAPRLELETGDACSLRIPLSSGVVILIDAIVVQNTSRGTAFDFVKMDEQSFFHLHNLVRYHSSDPDQVDNELTRPAFDRELLNRFTRGRKD